MLEAGKVKRATIDERNAKCILKKNLRTDWPWTCDYAELTSIGKYILRRLFPDFWTRVEASRGERPFPRFVVSVNQHWKKTRSESQLYYHGTSLGNLYGMLGRGRRAMYAGENGLIFAYRTEALVHEKEYTIFEYIGNGVLVRCTCILAGNFRVKKGSSGPQMQTESATIEEVIMELVSPEMLADLEHVWKIAYAC